MQKRIIGIGELLWDKLPGEKAVGGAPANFVFHAHRLGANAILISAVGDDDEGKEIMKHLNVNKLKYCIETVEYPTGEVTVRLNKGIPEYKINENAAWDYIPWNNNLRELLSDTDAIYFGTLAQRNENSRKTILKCMEISGEKCKKIFDINLRKQYYNVETLTQSLNIADIVKLNIYELNILSQRFNLKGDNKSTCRKLLSRFDIELIALTLGEDGSNLITHDDFSFCKATKVRVLDTVGAGDAFTAVLALGYLHGLPLEYIHQAANDYASLICGSKGATPVVSYRFPNLN